MPGPSARRRRCCCGAGAHDAGIGQRLVGRSGEKRLRFAEPNSNGSKARPTTAGEIFGNTRFGSLFEGKERVTLEDVKNPAFWFDTVRDLIVAILIFIPRLVVALLFLFFFWMIYRAVRRLVLGSMVKAHVDESIRDMLGQLLKWSIMGFGLVVACNQIGVQIAALLTAAGVIGLAVGFAAQETLANFIAGIVHLLGQALPPRRLGGDRRDLRAGQARHVPQRSHPGFQRADDHLSQQLCAQPQGEQPHDASVERVSIPIGVAYKESIDAARTALLGTTSGDERIAKDPPPAVVVAECGDSSVNLLLRFWLLDESLEKVIVFEYLEKSKKAFDAAGIQIPFPHMQLMVEDTPAIHSLAGNGHAQSGVDSRRRLIGGVADRRRSRRLWALHVARRMQCARY